MVYDELSKSFIMRCFADCNIPHPLDLLRLGGSSNWKILNEKILEYRTHLDQNRTFLFIVVLFQVVFVLFLTVEPSSKAFRLYRNRKLCVVRPVCASFAATATKKRRTENALIKKTWKTTSRFVVVRCVTPQ